MPQEDYLKKQIDQLGRVHGEILADMIGLKSKGRIFAGKEDFDQILKEVLDIADLTEIPADVFIATLISCNKFNYDNFEKIADILFLIAEEAEQGDKWNSKRIKLLERSLMIYEYLDKSSMTYSLERHLKMEKIKNFL